MSMTMEERQEAAARIIRDSKRETTLTDHDVTVMGARENSLPGDGPARAQIRVPMNDPVELMWHLEILAAAISNCRLILQKRTRDRAALMDVGAILRRVNRQLNAKRQGQ